MDHQEDHAHTELFPEESKPERPYLNFGTGLGESYPPCCKDIHEHGVVLMVSPMDKHGTEDAVIMLRESGFAVDWHWVSSRPVVKIDPRSNSDTNKARTLFLAACDSFEAQISENVRKLNQSRT